MVVDATQHPMQLSLSRFVMLSAVLFSSDAKALVAKRIHDKERGRARLVLRVLDVAEPVLRALTERR
mgnify:CR=1 FL=1